PNAPNPGMSLQRYWTLTETGDLTGRLTFHYVDADVPTGVTDESAFAINRYTTSFAQIPSAVNGTSNTATTDNSISEFSDWTLLPFSPTAARVTVSGRVTTANGVGISNARVTLTDGGNFSASAQTSSFGYYSIQNVPIGTVIGTVTQKRYTFEARAFNVSDSIADANFVAAP
ncbi:MAG TPA: carboxypeptidase-like regulatory domain-containing protein, partial [Pyrinomonadaceae bacterium]|nr:carboxypeptidase-like regulatory domain-containing protein [Pyrinomonadaceae bacterium]